MILTTTPLSPYCNKKRKKERKKLKDNLKKKLLVYDNANQECQRATAPIRDTGSTFDYLKACLNIGSETQKMQMLAETMVAALRKGK